MKKRGVTYHTFTLHLRVVKYKFCLASFLKQRFFFFLSCKKKKKCMPMSLWNGKNKWKYLLWRILSFWNLEYKASCIWKESLDYDPKNFSKVVGKKSQWVYESHLVCLFRETVSYFLKYHLCTSNLKLNVESINSRQTISILVLKIVFCLLHPNVL